MNYLLSFLSFLRYQGTPLNRFKPPSNVIFLAVQRRYFCGFGVRFCTVFHLLCVLWILVRFRLLSCHLLGKSCSFGELYVLFVLCLFVILVVSYFGFENGTVVLIAPLPCHCLPLVLIRQMFHFI